MRAERDERPVKCLLRRVGVVEGGNTGLGPTENERETPRAESGEVEQTRTRARIGAARVDGYCIETRRVRSRI